MKIHKKSKSFNCIACEYSCHNKGALKNHEVIHTGQKPYECMDCDKKFAWKQDLAEHGKRVHEKLKPFKCTICEKMYSVKGDLTKHIKSNQSCKAKELA